MPIDVDGKDFAVQFTDRAGGEWKGSDVFADVFSAKQHAKHLLDSGKAASVRVVQTRLYGWHDSNGITRWIDDIGEKGDNDRT